MQLGFVKAILLELSFNTICRIGTREGRTASESWTAAGKAEHRYAGVTHIGCLDMDAAAIGAGQRSLDRHDLAICDLSYHRIFFQPILWRPR